MMESSRNKSVFNGEVAIHFQGLNGLDMPIVWVFPKEEICLNSGVAQFEVPERELRVLRDRSRYLAVDVSRTKDSEQEKTFPQQRKVA
jgi:hypothetical protein